VVFVVDAEVFALLLDTYMHGVSPLSIAPINYRWLPTTIRLHRPSTVTCANGGCGGCRGFDDGGFNPSTPHRVGRRFESNLKTFESEVRSPAVGVWRRMAAYGERNIIMDKLLQLSFIAGCRKDQKPQRKYPELRL
jgi:hypothetical protein